MKSISIVIPVFNQEKFIGALLKSILAVNYPKEYYEIVVVSDCSTDRTTEVVKKYPQVRLIELSTNMGKYQARKIGAEAAKYPHLLFIDSRSIVDPDTLSAIDRLDSEAICGYSLGDVTPNPFGIFYRAIRRIVFANFYKNYNKPFLLTVENFDSMPKGTTIFYVAKDVLFKAYEELSLTDMGKEASDDTKLLRTIVERVPILLHPEVRITNFPHHTFKGNIDNLFARGAKFVDYYFDPKKKNFWLVIVFPLTAMFGILICLIFIQISGIVKLTTLISLNILLALLLTRKVGEFPVIFLMLPLCTVVFYLGIIRGILIKIGKTLKK